MADLRADPDRTMYADGVGIYVRAIDIDGRWDAVDIAALDRASLREFATSRGPVSDWALSILEQILGHPRPTTETEEQK